jgi:sugar phosphate isomerase/epimerase
MQAAMKAAGVGWGTCGLSVDFRKGDDEFNAGMRALPGIAAAVQGVGVKRVGTWVSPTHDGLTYLENFKIHARRLRETATVLGDHGLRLGLEYVGPKTSWTARRYPFVHTLKEMRELIAEIGRPNVGLVLDSWHWYTAGEGLAELKTLSNREIVSVDLNDAPAGVALDQQKDSAREIPLATGVIDTAGFLTTLNGLDCDAPVRCEPFNAALRAMPPDQALKTTIEAMRKAFALIRS